MKDTFAKVVLAFLVVSSMVTVVAASDGTEPTKDVWDFEEFSDGDAVHTRNNNTIADTSQVYQGDVSGQLQGGDAYDITEINASEGQNATLAVYIANMDTTGRYVTFRSDLTNVVRIYTDSGNVEYVDSGGIIQDTGIDVQTGEWAEFEVDADFASNEFNLTVYNKTSVVGTATGLEFENAGTHFDNVFVQDEIRYSHVDIIGDKSAIGEETTETNLELDIRRWMPFNSEQRYEVYLNVTNTTTGDTNLTDVTEDANVTVYNITNTSTFTEPIVTVNNSTDTLRSYNQTGVVAVNATYDGNTLGNATNLTVGNRNLSNIGIMPPSQWIPSFFEIDETVGGHGIGSSMQWILFIIFIMAAAARMFDNPWVGIGAGMTTAILIWVLGYVDLGVVLATTFTAIFLSLLLLRAKRMKVSLPATQ